jgi:acetolactate synthase-1/2/3 large subunit
MNVFSDNLAAPFDMADVVVAYLNQLEVEYIFGVPGGAIEPLYNAIARQEKRGGVRHVLARHETGAAFMAEGYARETGKLGVCCATSGPGVTNMITGVANANANRVPVLAITGQPSLKSFGRNALQESSCTGIDVVAMMSHCTQYSTLISHPAQIENKFISAVSHSLRGARGASHLSVPNDIFRMPSEHGSPLYKLERERMVSHHYAPSDVINLFHTITNSQNPVVLVGAHAGPAIPEIMSFVKENNIPFVSTPDGKGFVDINSPLYCGVVGFSGHQSAMETVNDPAVDLLIAIGATIGELNTGGWSAGILNEHLVIIDECDQNLMRAPMAKLQMHGNTSAIMRGLNTMINLMPMRFRGNTHGPVTITDFVCSVSDDTPIKPQRLMRELSSMFPSNTRFFADNGNSFSWAIHHLNPGIMTSNHLSRGWLHVTTEFASMGWAIGTSVGAAMANPESPVVCITGDGSMLMSGQELSTAVAERIPMIFVVLNDSTLGMVYHGQKMGGAEPIATDIPVTNFAAIAQAMGAQSFVINSAVDLEALNIKALLAHNGPTLLDVRIDREEVPPMKSRVAVLTDTVE